ncbi:MAG: methyltransferase domain-containing protein, partial [Planctomycetaceae bacterium]
MSSPPLQWDPAQYLRFVQERTRPCQDLVATLGWLSPRRIVDLGCGPGNSTRVLAERWPAAQILGVDLSAEMLASARHDLPGCDWQQADLSDWTPPAASYDLIFSNAALQWVPRHQVVL